MLTRWINLFVLMVCFVLALCFTSGAHATGFYRPPCEALEKHAGIATETLAICVKEGVRKSEGARGELFCQTESAENLKSLNELEKCRYQNELFPTTSPKPQEK